MDAEAEYWREGVMEAFEACDLWDAIKDIPMEKLSAVGACRSRTAECHGMVFYTPENPSIGENKRLERKLKWERELEHCEPCKGTGRIQYNSGSWGVDTGCSKCHGAGKVHPRNESEPS